jgi:hypothetical protein
MSIRCLYLSIVLVCLYLHNCVYIVNMAAMLVSFLKCSLISIVQAILCRQQVMLLISLLIYFIVWLEAFATWTVATILLFGDRAECSMMVVWSKGTRGVLLSRSRQSGFIVWAVGQHRYTWSQMRIPHNHCNLVISVSLYCLVQSVLSVFHTIITSTTLNSPLAFWSMWIDCTWILTLVLRSIICNMVCISIADATLRSQSWH